MKEEIRTEEEIRERLEYLQHKKDHVISLYFPEKNYIALMAEIKTLQWVLKEGGIE